MSLIRWSELVPNAADCHLTRTIYRPGQSFALHDHDYCEVCWIEAGCLRHDTPSGTRRLNPGDTVLIRPGQLHALHGASDGATTLVNCAFSAGRFADLERRFQASPGWPWRNGSEAGYGHLEPGDLSDLAKRVDRLGQAAPSDDLAREAFLIDLIDRLRRHRDLRWPEAPAWLSEALERLATPPLLAQGLPALVRLTGRSREHLSRTIHTHCGLRAIELLTTLRLHHAEQRLALSDEAVSDIAKACGFVGRARFHRLFLAHAGQTPLAYRRRCRGAVAHG